MRRSWRWTFGLLVSGGVLAVGAAGAPVAAVITVTTAGDAVNGDVSSPAALLATPGPDGVSLREALQAANNAAGPREITFATALGGQTISPLSALPPIAHSGVMLSGLTDAAGNPTVTISGASLSAVSTPGGLLTIRASDVTVQHLELVHLRAGGRGFLIQAGTVQNKDGGSAAPQQVSDIRVANNVLDNTGQDATTWAVSLSLDDSSAGATLSSVQIVGNRFVHFVGDGDEVLVGATGMNGTIQAVTIADNSFSDTTYAVELTPTGPGGATPQTSADKVLGTRILRNTFTNVHDQAIVMGIGRGNRGNLIDDTVISGNAILSARTPIGMTAGYLGASNNTISNTQIVNNVIASGAMLLVGGADGGTNNRIDHVQIANDTINAAIGMFTDQRGSSGNTISDVSVSNSIFSGGDIRFNGEMTPSMLHTSLVSQASFAGTNGNIFGDAQFVDAANGDFHLRAGSPAIDSGTSVGAPATDFDGRARQDGHVDIGAYEFGATALPRLTVAVADNGGATGEVTSSPAGIDCPAICGAGFPAGSSLSLVAAPWPGAVFAGWSGACTGTSACTVTMAAAKAVTATFAPITYALAVAAVGKGVVTNGPAGISCPASCTADFEQGDSVTLTATPDPGYRFEWSGACSGSSACAVTMEAAKTVTATFSQITHSVSVTIAGKGRVTSSPAGIACPSACSTTLAEATTLRLSAAAAAGYVFSGWSGACSAKAVSCALTVGADTQVLAKFTRLPLCKKGQRSTPRRRCRKR